LGGVRGPDRAPPPAGVGRGRRRATRGHLYAGIAERFMLLSRSPGILERVSARPPKRRTRIAVRVLAGLPALAACSSSPPVPPAVSPASSAASPVRTAPPGA